MKGVGWRPWRLRRLATNPSGAIYGTIVATALIAAASAHGTGPGEIALAVSLTLLVFWLAHVYTEVLGDSLRTGERGLAVVRRIMADELAMIEEPLTSIGILLVGAAGWIGGGLAVNLALADGVAQLLLWGIAVGRRMGRSWPAALLTGLVDAAFGVLIVVIKVLVH